ncbi:hypothetical protein F1D05_09010 [Kribbella qitaiheensis]|uniref:Uncharacterized protein n=1 Tax=Kribbella qitaiheensis TaxID=1544730 RepID=A0A7G6WVI1_9ACTN|nr:hypothetical protein [Kribbella qitaiheensis]QNE17996.1 hypothetical protein F1D05_09010 [Kribbella qitaiheensis]
MSPRRVFPALRSANAATKLFLAGLLLLLTAAGVAYGAKPAKPGITLGISPASQSITQGKSATYTVAITSAGGFTGKVTLTASGLPSGASAAFSPSSVTLTSGSTGSTTLTISTTSSTPIASSTITVRGTSGNVSGTVVAGLTVNAPLSSALSMSATPASVTMAPGSTAVFTVQLARTNLPGSVTFAVLGGLPAGATATFTPNPTTGNSSALQITTPATAADGGFTLYLVSSGKDRGGTTRYAYASVGLVLAKAGNPFTISGNLSGALAPGLSRPLDLTLANPNKKPLSVTNLTVTVKTVTRTAYAIAHNQPCTTADYAVTQYSGSYPLTVPGNGSASLSSLGVSTSAQPKVSMLNTALNQDGCKGATLTLAYSGSGQGS